MKCPSVRRGLPCPRSSSQASLSAIELLQDEGDPQGTRTILIAAPNRQGAARWDLLNEAFGQKLGNDLASGAACQIGCGTPRET
jgi:hypothetical protein